MSSENQIQLLCHLLLLLGKTVVRISSETGWNLAPMFLDGGFRAKRFDHNRNRARKATICELWDARAIATRLAPVMAANFFRLHTSRGVSKCALKC